jgi:hypothetical protein
MANSIPGADADMQYNRLLLLVSNKIKFPYFLKYKKMKNKKNK